MKAPKFVLIATSIIAALCLAWFFTRNSTDIAIQQRPTQFSENARDQEQGSSNEERRAPAGTKTTSSQQLNRLNDLGQLTKKSFNGIGEGATPSPSTPAGPHLVGREVCRECHQENFQLHAAHGHAHTFHVLDESPEIVAKFAGKTFNAGKEFGTYEYQAKANTSDSTTEVKQLTATLPAIFGDSPFPLQYALGSGHNAYTLLTLITEENGDTAALEHRASWYTKENRLDITPGHADQHPADGLELFGVISHGESMEKCIDCHTTSAAIVGEQIKDLIPSVNCEKCHGAGSEHVRLARTNKVPPPYSVGKNDWDTESEIQLCGDCHRLPKNISDKELREYPDLLARFQPVGLLRSRCYLESEGKMRCTTCHGPHEALHEVPKSRHIENCINCHKTPEHTLCPISPKEDCIRCHMPAMRQEQGLTFHDHWIRVRED